MQSLKRHLGSLLVGALIVGGLAYVGAGALTRPTEEVVLAQENDSPEGGDGNGGGKRRFGLHGAIRGELVVPGEEEGTFQTVRLDRGILERVDGSTVVIKEGDGTTVEIPTTDDTRIVRDGEQAAVGDLKQGDHVRTIRIKEGDNFVTKSVRAISPERYEQRQERREQCRENREACRMMRRRGPGRMPNDDAGLPQT